MSTGMDQRELESCIKQLNKVVQANEPPATALALLERLKKEAAPTEEMLRVRCGLHCFYPHAWFWHISVHLVCYCDET